MLTQVFLCRSRDSRSPSAVRLPAAPPPPRPVTAPPSKMDKYFQPDYDPRLDVSVSDLTSSNGLVADGGFDGWDTMLSVVKDRKEEKKAREAREKELRRREREKIREEREEKRRRKDRRKKGRSSGSESESPRPATESRRTAAGDGLLGVEYASKGSTREWDMGKVVQ